MDCYGSDWRYFVVFSQQRIWRLSISSGEFLPDSSLWSFGCSRSLHGRFSSLIPKMLRCSSFISYFDQHQFAWLMDLRFQVLYSVLDNSGLHFHTKDIHSLIISARLSLFWLTQGSLPQYIGHPPSWVLLLKVHSKARTLRLIRAGPSRPSSVCLFILTICLYPLQ